MRDPEAEAQEIVEWFERRYQNLNRKERTNG